MNESLDQKKNDSISHDWVSAVASCHNPGSCQGENIIEFCFLLFFFNLENIQRQYIHFHRLWYWVFSPAIMHYLFHVHDSNEAINFVCFLYHEVNYYISMILFMNEHE